MDLVFILAFAKEKKITCLVIAEKRFAHGRVILVKGIVHTEIKIRWEYANSLAIQEAYEFVSSLE